MTFLTKDSQEFSKVTRKMFHMYEGTPSKTVINDIWLGAYAEFLPQALLEIFNIMHRVNENLSHSTVLASRYILDMQSVQRLVFLLSLSLWNSFEVLWCACIYLP